MKYPCQLDPLKKATACSRLFYLLRTKPMGRSSTYMPRSDPAMEVVTGLVRFDHQLKE
ncbi:MAG: hypothetical protein GY820_01120 [Gammaproteobacteria bacterium]|nr:hypothetical protein [Gammaproteobacteria bacterium]